MPTYNGTSGADVFTAPDNQDWTINGLGGTDTLTGGGGNDTILGGKGNDVLNGGGGNDQFLVGTGGGADTIDGGDADINGGIGYDVIKATVDNMKIGLEAFVGIEEISADGHIGVTINGSANDNVFDFTNVLLTGIGLVSGGNGNDTIIGNAQDNVFDGGSGNDTLVGGAGNDIFQIGKNAGLDSFDGGTGTDTIIATADGAHIGLGSITGIEVISGGDFGNVVVDGTSGDDYMYFAKTTLTNIFAVDAGDGNDTIIGSAGDDTLRGGNGDDIINGGNGDDTLYGEAGHDILSGGNGDDSFFASGGADIYKGGAGYDVIYANQNGANIQIDKGSLSSIEEISANGFFGVTISGANAAGSTIDLRHVILSDGDIAGINGTNGNDTIFGSQIVDYINGGLGDDQLSGFNGDDIIHGGGGMDTLIGGNGYDELHGDAGNDILDGGAQDDLIFGEAGNDTIIIAANPGFDTIDGGTGFDTILADDGVKTIKFASFTNIEAISWDGAHLAQILGTSGNDTFDFTNVALTGIKLIDGGDGDDIITGSAKDDVMDGSAGNDTLIGGSGNDTITGDIGADTLTGGLGNDIFKDNTTNLNGDTITDFALGDAIDLINVKNPGALVLSYDAGVLTVTGPGALAAGIHIGLPGAFTTSSFVVESDGAHGALIHLV